LVVTPALGLALWHGGYRGPAQITLAAVAVIGAVVLRPREIPRNPLWLGLVAVAAANAASLAWHPDRSSVAPALAAAALPAVVAIARIDPAGVRRHLPIVVVGLGLAIATTGLAGLVARAQPLAERIDGVWRAGGTFEYPPALGLLGVCALACTLGLYGSGRLDRVGTLIIGAILIAAVTASFDRAAWVETVAVGILFAMRVPATRRTVALLGAATAGCAVLALAVSHPSGAALERHLRHGAISSRTGVWDAALDAAGRRPLVGYGPGQFLAIYDGRAGRVVGQAHDAVLEQTVEAGIVAGVGTALVLIAMLAAGAAAAAGHDAERIGLGVTAVAVAISGLYDFTWSFAPIVLLGALAAASCTGET
jgi:O-antigen ligase